MSTTDGSIVAGGGGAPGPGGGPGGGNGGGATGALGSSNGVSTATSTGAKIAHVKTATIDASSGGNSITIGSIVGAGGSTIMTSGVSTASAIKVATAGGTVTSSIGAPIALNVAQSTTATAIRTIGAGGQSTQMRVVMPNIIPIKQFESGGAGRAQITAIPAAAAPRTISNTSITVTRPITQTTYLPRASVTATQMTGMTAGQRLVTPIRATSASGAAGATVSGLTTAGSFVRGTAVSRSSASPATTVISPATSTTWMQTNTGQVQLIRTIPQQSQKRIITAQGVGSASVSGTVVATTPTSTVQTIAGQASAQLTHGAQSAIQTVSSQAAPHSQQQQTYVATLATVLPPRQHQATLVYSSNVAAGTSQPLSQPQQFNPAVPAGQRYALSATPLTTGTGATPRQIRPIPLGKPFSTTKLNTTSISIRAPNIPQLTSTLATGVTGTAVAGGNAATAAANSPRSTTMTGVTGSTGNVIPATNLSTTRIIQLQQQPGGSTQQIIGSTGRLPGSMMFQPIIVNASGSGKIGIRQPVSMAAKVQPSLTITPFGIGKLPAANAGATAISHQQQQQNVTANIQTITSGGGGVAASCISTTPTASVTATNLSTAATAQLVNVSQAAAAAAANQLLTAQNIVSSASGATVVPLAITTRGGAGGNILTGTITPIKNANSITVGKVMTQTAAQVAAAAVANTATVDGGSVAVSSAAPTSVYIHQPAAVQRPHNASNVSSVSVNSGTSVVTSTAAGVNTVLTSTGGATASGAFLPPGSTIYYESVPASSVQVSTGVLSLTTTTATSSTMSQNQLASSAANMAISSLPFASHAANSTATFTVVPSSGGRTFGQLQIPVSSAGTQIQAVRFSAQLTPGNVANAAAAAAAADAIAVSQATPQLMQSAVAGQQILIPAQHQGATTATLTGPQGQHVVIPLQTSIKVTSGGTSGTAVVSNFLRKRDAEGSPIRAAKNLGPTLLSMSSNMISAAGSPAASSVGSSFSIASVSSSSNASALTAEALAKKDRAAAGAISRPSRAESPASSDGSTTVSANSSPGVEQQMQDGNMVLSHMPGTSDSTHFNPINELYANHHTVTAMHHNMLGGTPASSRNSSLDHQQQLHAASSSAAQRLNGGPIDCLPRKKSRRSTNDSQLSSQSQASLTLPPPSSLGAMGHISSSNSVTNNHSHNMAIATDSTTSTGNGMLTAGGPGAATATYDGNGNHAIAGHNINHKTNNVTPTAGNKENAKPMELVLRRPRNCTLLNTYKQSWKAANNHFQRYSDVKPREERRPTVIDLANQANVLSKINGWKVYHLRSQMEDLCENESSGYDKLSTMLKQMESHGKNAEMERISELLKGNMQRSKIIVEGINEAQNQIMKIFEHKTHISDIIHRCASKRNFKKREKF